MDPRRTARFSRMANGATQATEVNWPIRGALWRPRSPHSSPTLSFSDFQSVRGEKRQAAQNATSPPKPQHHRAAPLWLSAEWPSSGRAACRVVATLAESSGLTVRGSLDVWCGGVCWSACRGPTQVTAGLCLPWYSCTSILNRIWYSATTGTGYTYSCKCVLGIEFLLYI